MRRALLVLVAAAGLACGRPGVQPTNRGDLQLSLDGGTPTQEVTHDFGLVPLGQTRVVVVTATNVGKDTLTLTRLTLEGSDTGSFFVRGELGDVPPSASTSATVTFAPARAGAQSTRLIFEHDADAPRPAANLSGSGQ
ncbi:MAG: choice-of-anchor D domain-containing protein [Myxococcota bacterium]